MKINQYTYHNKTWEIQGEELDMQASVVLIKGDRKILESVDNAIFNEIHPNAHHIINSTSGEILGEELKDQGIYATAIEFEKSSVQIKTIDDPSMGNRAIGESISNAFKDIKDLKLIYLTCDGHTVNGSDLVEGILETIGNDIPITGGLAGDGVDFEKTIVGLNGINNKDRVIAMAISGQDLKVGCGSYGGWNEFGVEKVVTKSEANVLFELDGGNALELYKTYLGEQSKELPGAALLFPLGMTDEGQGAVVRTILSVDHEAGSMTFAGNIPVGSKVKLMKSNMNELIDGAGKAADQFKQTCPDPELLILISCVGRRLVLGQLTEDEIEEVSGQFSSNPKICGYYSYGEISPGVNGICQLHNQTMTITALSEI